MNVSVNRKISRKKGLVCSLFFLLSALSAFLLCVPEEERKDIPVFSREGYSVLCDSPEMKGETRVFSRMELMRGKLLLVSPAHPLPEDLPLPDTRAVRAMVGAFLPAEANVLLCAETVYALCEMEMAHPLEDGVIFSGGALSYAQQEEKRKDAYARYARILPLEEALRAAQAWVPGGRETEHRLGTAVDLTLTGILALSEENPLCRNETGRWLKENMAGYGFIQRFAPGEESEGGCENVHIRYVGRVHASVMQVLGMTMEEYLDFLHKQKGITVMKAGEKWATVFCVPWTGGSLSLPVPPGRETEISADNTGYAILTVLENGKERAVK